MTRFLQSFHPYEVKFPAKGSLPEVIAPKRVYAPELVAAGRRPVVAINEQQHQRLVSDEVFQALAARGQYRFLDHVPESMKNAEDKLQEARLENEKLKAQLREQEKKSPVPKETVFAVKTQSFKVATKEQAPPTASSEEQLEKKPGSETAVGGVPADKS